MRPSQGQSLPRGHTASLELGFGAKPGSGVSATPLLLLQHLNQSSSSGPACPDPRLRFPVPLVSLPTALFSPDQERALGKVQVNTFLPDMCSAI